MIFLCVEEFRAYQSGKWYAALDHFRLASLSAAVIDDLHIGAKNLPQGGTFCRSPNAEGDVNAEEYWKFSVDDLPATALLTFGAKLAALNGKELGTPIVQIARSALDRMDYFEALQLFQLGVAFGEKLDDVRTQCRMLEEMSRIHRHLGNYDLALELLERTVELESSLSYSREIAENVKVLVQGRNDPDELRQMVEIRSHSMALNRGCKLATIASLHAELGDQRRAESFLEEAERIFEKFRHPYCQADLLNLRATWDLREGQWKIARQRLERALEITRRQVRVQVADERGRELLKTRQGMHSFRVSGGLPSYRVIVLSSSTSPLVYLAMTAELIAETYLQEEVDLQSSPVLRKEALSKAAQWQQTAFDGYEAVNDHSGRLSSRLRMAGIAVRQGQHQVALRLLNSLESQAEKQGAFEIHWKILALRGSINRSLGRTAAAVNAYEEAAGRVESVRATMRRESSRRGFFGSHLAVYEQLAQLYLQQREDLQQRVESAESARLDELIWNCVERSKARTLLDMLGGRSLKFSGADVKQLAQEDPKLLAVLRGTSLKATADYESVDRSEAGQSASFRELASLASTQPIGLGELQKHLNAEDLVVEYFVTDETILAAVVSSSKLQIHRLKDIDRDLLQQLVTEYRGVLQNPESSYASLARRIFDLLLAPCLRDHPDVRHLCIVPGDTLHYLPFGALMQDERFVAEDYLLSYAPSASALVYALERQRHERLASGEAIIVAEPVEHSDFGALPGAVIEGERIHDLAASPKQILTGENATETSVAQLLGKSRYFHFAGHTDFSDSRPMRTALLCTEDVDEDGRLEVAEIFEMSLRNCRLAVLSACDTRLGSVSRGDEVVGLERAFLRAGVPTVVASLWKVEDAATSMLMQEFYQNLWQKKQAPAHALWQAQLSVLRSPQDLEKHVRELNLRIAGRSRGPKLTVTRPFAATSEAAETGLAPRTHPAYWAAFVLSGDWR